ncbi:MAG: antitoxin HicB [Nitrospinales bacterium]|jgi:antitoxin HicB
MGYPFQIRELSKDDGGGFLITFPDLPGCMSDGDTIDEAMKNGEVAVKDWVKARKKFGKNVPEPSPPIDTHDYSGKFIQRVPKSVHAQLAKRAEAEGVSMNQLAATYLVSGLADGGKITKRILKKNK